MHESERMSEMKREIKSKTVLGHRCTVGRGVWGVVGSDDGGSETANPRAGIKLFTIKATWWRCR